MAGQVFPFELQGTSSGVPNTWSTARRNLQPPRRDRVDLGGDNLSDEDFARFASEIERRCPVTTLFRDSGVDYKASWTNLPTGG